MALATEAVMTGLTILSALERKVLWPATWMIHNAITCATMAMG